MGNVLNYRSEYGTNLLVVNISDNYFFPKPNSRLLSFYHEQLFFKTEFSLPLLTR